MSETNLEKRHPREGGDLAQHTGKDSSALPQNNIKNLIQKLKSNTGLTPIMAAEIEFYSGNETLETIQQKLSGAKIPTIKIEHEKGLNQYEIVLPASINIAELAKNIAKIKEVIDADFSAKPYPDQPGSGLHFHLSLVDKNGKNVFVKTGDVESNETLHTIGGLLAAMPESMIYFAPNPESYARFVAYHHPENQTYDNAPTKISWGGNNRTTAIRIPESTIDPNSRHIEHRVPGVDADPSQCIKAILAGAIYGLVNKIDPGEKIYGNVYDPQYRLPELPKSLSEAEELSKQGKILKRYF